MVVGACAQEGTSARDAHGEYVAELKRLMLAAAPYSTLKMCERAASSYCAPALHVHAQAQASCP